jgi:nucleoprotein TPR
LKAKYQELQQTLDSERIAWLNDKKTLEDTIVDMTVLERQSEGDRTLQESAIQDHEERVKVKFYIFLAITLCLIFIIGR